MFESTRQIVKTALAADPSVPVGERTRLLKILSDGPESATVPHARILRRGEVANRMAVSVRAVDEWAASGLLRKVTLPGRTRAAGFKESDVVALIEGRRAS